MPVDYSKWDALELSDDSDIEVHPNVDKRSFIRAKQGQIHQERLQRKHRIETLKYERIINDGLIKRISGLLAALRAHASEAATRNPGEVAFQAVMESAGDAKEDQPPPRPEGVHADVKEQPTYSKMMVVLLDQVNKALDEKKPQDRYGAMMDEIREHEDKVRKLQSELLAKLGELEREDSKKITSADIHTGFDSSHVNKSASKGQSTQVELLNPQASSSSSAPSTKEDDEGEAEASPDAKKFAQIKSDDYTTSLAFLSQHPHILTERDSDGILVLAFDAGLERDDDRCRQCVHQGLLLQYCRALGKDGVALFFKRITTKGHQAQGVFYRDVQDTYTRIRNRSREILAERAANPEGEGVAQIQLHAVDPGTAIQFWVPPADGEEPEVQRARQIYDGFRPEMRKALASASLDEVNKVLGKMEVEEAEKVANILSLEEQLIDATTDEGKKQLEAMEAASGGGGGDESFPPRPSPPHRRIMPSLRAVVAIVASVAVTAATAAATPAAAGSDAACNNSPALCSRAYNKMTHLGAHDSSFLRDKSTNNSPAGNQFKNATLALDAGLRLLQTQLHKVESAQTDVERLRLCHSSCGILDAGPLDTWLRAVADWMGRNPNDVVTLLIVNADSVSSQEIGAAFERTGLARIAYRSPAQAPATTWPTLQTMISQGTRVVAFVTNMAAAPNAPYLIPEFDHVFETAFEITQLDGFNTTLDRPRRLGDAPSAAKAGYMGLVNHFKYENVGTGLLKSLAKSVGISTNIMVPDADRAKVVNSPSQSTEGTLGKHLEECRTQWGQAPTFVLVDFWDVAGPLEAIDSLNGLSYGSVTGRTAVAPGPVTASAGRGACGCVFAAVFLAVTSALVLV
ncbi:hypothetical protein CP533_5553 [Ophiocordyceps camponoti-saundersi (nom. inval.)]|nr:hypothetical protein CP533_5553 [Ophiocordyceps camponoti-saundersi (nom. inval.)]